MTTSLLIMATDTRRDVGHGDSNMRLRNRLARVTKHLDGLRQGRVVPGALAQQNTSSYEIHLFHVPATVSVGGCASDEIERGYPINIRVTDRRPTPGEYSHDPSRTHNERTFLNHLRHTRRPSRETARSASLPWDQIV